MYNESTESSFSSQQYNLPSDSGGIKIATTLAFCLGCSAVMSYSIAGVTHANATEYKRAPFLNTPSYIDDFASSSNANISSVAPIPAASVDAVGIFRALENLHNELTSTQEELDADVRSLLKDNFQGLLA